MSPVERLSVRSVPSGETHSLTPVGELDHATLPVLEAAVAAVAAGDAEMIVIDLGQLTFIDSAGINLLAKLQMGCRKGQLRIIGVAAGTTVDRVTSDAHVHDQLPSCPDDGDPPPARTPPETTIDSQDEDGHWADSRLTRRVREMLRQRTIRSRGSRARSSQ